MHTQPLNRKVVRVTGSKREWAKWWSGLVRAAQRLATELRSFGSWCLTLPASRVRLPGLATGGAGTAEL